MAIFFSRAMFTGLIEGIGNVVKSDGKTAVLHVPYRRLRRGESLSVDGVCLTVASFRGRLASFDIGRETRRVSTLGQLKSGQFVNLERAMTLGDRIGGHLVSGHVEGRGRLLAMRRQGRNWRL